MFGRQQSKKGAAIWPKQSYVMIVSDMSYCTLHHLTCLFMHECRCARQLEAHQYRLSNIVVFLLVLTDMLIQLSTVLTCMLNVWGNLGKVHFITSF